MATIMLEHIGPIYNLSSGGNTLLSTAQSTVQTPALQVFKQGKHSDSPKLAMFDTLNYFGDSEILAAKMT